MAENKIVFHIIKVSDVALKPVLYKTNNYFERKLKILDLDEEMMNINVFS